MTEHDSNGEPVESTANRHESTAKRHDRSSWASSRRDFLRVATAAGATVGATTSGLAGSGAADTLPAPADLSVTARRASRLEIEWSQPKTDDEIRGYDVYVGDERRLTVLAGGTSATVGALTPGENYEVAVVAVDAEGTESDPAVVEATTAEVDDPALDVTRFAVPDQGGGSAEPAADVEVTDRDDGTTVAIEGSFAPTSPCNSLVLQAVDYDAGRLRVSLDDLSNSQEPCPDVVAGIPYQLDVDVTEPVDEVVLEYGDGGWQTIWRGGETGPPAPTDLAVADRGVSSVEVDWREPETDREIAGYEVSVGDRSHSVEPRFTASTIAGLSPDETVAVDVATVGADGATSEPATVEATTRAIDDAAVTDAVFDVSSDTTGSPESRAQVDVSGTGASTTVRISGVYGGGNPCNSLVLERVDYGDGRLTVELADVVVSRGPCPAVEVGIPYDLDLSLTESPDEVVVVHAGRDWQTTWRGDETLPPAPGHLSVTERHETMVEIGWDEPETDREIGRYEVSVGQRSFRVSSQYTSSIVAGLSPDTTSEIGVTTVTSDGAESEAATIEVTTESLEDPAITDGRFEARPDANGPGTSEATIDVTDSRGKTTVSIAGTFGPTSPCSSLFLRRVDYHGDTLTVELEDPVESRGACDTSVVGIPYELQVWIEERPEAVEVVHGGTDWQTTWTGDDPGTGTLEVTADGETVGEGAETDVALSLSSVPEGLSGYTIDVSVDDPSVARITGGSYPDAFEPTEPPELEGDGSSIRLKASDVRERIDPGAEDVDLATVRLSAESAGQVEVAASVEALDTDDGGRAIPEDAATTLTVRSLEPVVGDALPTDPDDDGDYEDLNGNDRLDFDDVVEYFQHRDEGVLTDHVDAYDYNDNGRIDYNDVVTLFEER